MKRASRFTALLASASLFSFTASAQQAGPVSQMPDASTPLDGSELIYIIQHGISAKTNLSSLGYPFNGVVFLQRVTFSSLPACNSSTMGYLSLVTDAASPITTWHQQVTAGLGVNIAFVACNGTGWFAFDY